MTQAQDAETRSLQDHTGGLPPQRGGLLLQGDTDAARRPPVWRWIFVRVCAWVTFHSFLLTCHIKRYNKLTGSIALHRLWRWVSGIWSLFNWGGSQSVNLHWVKTRRRTQSEYLTGFCLCILLHHGCSWSSEGVFIFICAVACSVCFSYLCFIIDLYTAHIIGDLNSILSGKKTFWTQYNSIPLNANLNHYK